MGKGSLGFMDWYKYEFWRFVFVQKVMAEAIQSSIDYPPMQRGASFNLDAVKANMAKGMEQAEAASKGPGHKSQCRSGRAFGPARFRRYILHAGERRDRDAFVLRPGKQGATGPGAFLRRT